MTVQKCQLCEAITPLLLLYSLQNNCFCHMLCLNRSDSHNEHLGYYLFFLRVNARAIQRHGIHMLRKKSLLVLKQLKEGKV